MRVVRGLPPNYAEIRKRFRVSPGTVFTYGSTVFTQSGRPLPPDLLAHEAVHVRQQGDDPAGWWERYLADDAFRLEQEVAAYRAQYQATEGRGPRRALLERISRDLAGPMYGNLLSRRAAREAISAP